MVDLPFVSFYISTAPDAAKADRAAAAIKRNKRGVAWSVLCSSAQAMEPVPIFNLTLHQDEYRSKTQLILTSC